MTSAHSMFTRLIRLRLQCARCVRLGAPAAILACSLLVLLASCRSEEKLQPPSQLVSPYVEHKIWAVAPFVNESGVSIVRSDRVADLFAHEAQDIHNIATIPVNRVIYAMQRLQMRSVATPRDAHTLMNVLDVDGLIVGTITAYDPYSPPRLGAAVQLFVREPQVAMTSIDPVQATRATSERTAPVAAASHTPVAQASGMFDAANHQTLTWLDQYATGRTEPNSAYGRRIYLVNMELYTQFVAHRLLHDLLLAERHRLQPAMTTQVNTR